MLRHVKICFDLQNYANEHEEIYYFAKVFIAPLV